jgi:two-component system OmpR family response regulator
VRTAADGREMRAAMRNERFALVVLDVMLPGTDGLTLCRELRAESSIPIIMLTARGDETDRIVGLEMGADDYLPKPFNPRELLARINATLRRAKPGGDDGVDGLRRVRFAGWMLDLVARHLVGADEVITPLSSGEFRLLKAFVEHPNRVLTRDQLLDFTRGRDWDPFDRSIDVQISRLRRRLHDDSRTPTLIKTIRGEGYVLAAQVEREA